MKTGIYRERTFTSFDGLALYFRDYGPPGTTIPLICLTGLTRNSKDFHGLATRLLGAGRRVLCPDYRGRGRSQYDPAAANYKPETYVRDVIDLAAATGVHKAVFVGTSLGGLVTMAMALARPGLIAGVILNDVGPELPKAGLGRIAGYVGQALSFSSWEEAAAAYKARYGFANPDAGNEEWLPLARDTFAEDADGTIRTDYDVAIAQNLSGAPLPDLWPMYRALGHVPLLGLRGELSDILEPEIFARMGREHPDFTAVTVPRVGHVPKLTEPEAEAAIDSYLARL